MIYNQVPQILFDMNGRIYMLDNSLTKDYIQYNATNISVIQPFQFNPNCTNINCQKCVKSSYYQKIIRKKVELDQRAKEFKEKFYSFFTCRKRIPKDDVFNIHNNIAKEINLRYVSRDECRSVDKYFKNFSIYQNEIINHLSSLSNEQRNKLKNKSINLNKLT